MWLLQWKLLLSLPAHCLRKNMNFLGSKSPVTTYHDNVVTQILTIFQLPQVKQIYKVKHYVMNQLITFLLKKRKQNFTEIFIDVLLKYFNCLYLVVCWFYLASSLLLLNSKFLWHDIVDAILNSFDWHWRHLEKW